MPTGSAATVAFKVEHGCDGSPTVSLAIQIPVTITDARPVDKAGWTGTAAANVVTYTGGPLDPDTQDTFAVSFTAPGAPGEVRFPIIQTCAVGEIAWLDIAVDGQPEPETPAPVLEITGEAIPTTEPATTEPATTEPAATESATTRPAVSEPATTAAPAATDASADTTEPVLIAPISADTEAAVPVVATAAAGGGSDGGGSSKAPIVIGALAVAAAAGAGVALARRRR